MLSSDKNIDTINQLISELHKYVQLRTELYKVNAVSILSKLLTALILGAVMFVLAALAFMLLSLMCVAALTTLTGSEPLAYLLVIAFYLLLALIVYQHRLEWIERPITHFLVKLLLPQSETDNQETK